MIEKSAGIILFRGSPPQFLLLHYPAGHWDFAKGKLEPGETELQAALRELQEETGITHVQVLPDFKETIQYYFRKEGETVRKTVVDFLAETAEKDVQISAEHIGYVWLPYKAALERLTFKNAKQELEKAMQFLRAQRRA